MTEQSISIEQFRKKISKLPKDPPLVRPGIWYTTQWQHWQGWLDGYDGPGAYGRKNWNRDAKFAYNHIVCPGLLLYLIQAIPLQQDIVATAQMAERDAKTFMAKAGAIRKVVPWEMIYQALWGRKKSTLVERLQFNKTREK
jgi:hypothetical protein